jgi:hypothetical protein
MSGLTYRTQALKDADRDHQRELLKALTGSKSALQLDLCGAWRINGKRGHIYTWDDQGGGWAMLVSGRSARHWQSLKRQLAFCAVSQDGDDGGCLRLLELPSPRRAAAIRKALGISKTKPAPRRALQPDKKGGFGPKNGRDGGPRYPGGREDKTAIFGPETGSPERAA